MTDTSTTPSTSAADGSGVRHPLDPLTGDELRRAARAALASLGAHTDGTAVRVIDVSLHEPEKAAVHAHRPGDAGGGREAWVVIHDRRRPATHELVVSLSTDEVIAAQELLGVQPAITPTEWDECEAAVRADPRFQEALARRGIEDMRLVTIEAWGIGTHADEDHRKRRLAWTPCWVREDEDDNAYAHPIDGVYALVDLNTMEVVEIEDHGVTPIPSASGRYTPEHTGLPPRPGLKPLDIVQPEGPSFDVDGWQVSWQRWQLRLGFTAREGLVLHEISYEDGGRRRPIIHRASFVELIVPYGDPGPAGYRKSAYDIGEYGIGPMTNSLELGCDCLGHIHYFDVDLCDDRGEPYTITNAICLHEEDVGLAWKHTDQLTDHAEARRLRRLVISFIVTIGNYEYAFYWYLYQDGTIESEIKATGIVLTQGEAAGAADYGVTVAPGLVATHHQHFFCARLDMEVDGDANTVYEVNTETVPPGDGNPAGNAFRPVVTPLAREAEARRRLDPLTGRYWLIANDGARNGIGGRVAYKLMPGTAVLPFAAEDSDLTRRAEFLRHNVWVTAFDRRERFPAGDYPNQHPGGDGLPAYQRADREIVNADVVLWYAFGMLHISRPEDWPVMPVERIGFMLKPSGFFDRNPALDLPRPAHGGSGHC